MASRKAKPRAKRPSQVDVHEEVATVDARPSSSMTIELNALTAEQLVSAARSTSDKLPPAAPTTVRVLEDLAATVEMPALGALGPRLLVMDAAEAVIADSGFGPDTVKETTEWAGISIDVFHAHFTDERALLAALTERFCAHIVTFIDDATRAGTWDGAVAAKPVDFTIRGVVDLMLSRAALLRAILASGDRELIDEQRRVGTHLTVRLTRVLGDMADVIDRPDPIDVGFAVLMAVSIAQHAAVVGTEWSGVELDREQLARRASEAANAYIASSLRSR